MANGSGLHKGMQVSPETGDARSLVHNFQKPVRFMQNKNNTVVDGKARLGQCNAAHVSAYGELGKQGGKTSSDWEVLYLGILFFFVGFELCR